MNWVNRRIQEGRAIVKKLLLAPKLSMDKKAVKLIDPNDDEAIYAEVMSSHKKSLRSKLPISPGIYAISIKDSLLCDFLYIGKSLNLQQRIDAHRSGGDLLRRLVDDGHFQSKRIARNWIKKHCIVQCIELDKESIEEFLSWVEPFVIGVLRPCYRDQHKERKRKIIPKGNV